MADDFIKSDRRNYRKHSDENKRLIKKSLMECGTGRSIVIDNENEIIAGNGVFEQALELGIPVKIVETEGDELIAVKRKDLNRNDEKRDKLAILDNSTTDLSEFDYDLLKEDFEVEYLKNLGVELPAEKQKDKEGQIEFTEELLEEHNYIVLYFDNSVDWLQAETMLGDLLKTKKGLSSKDNYEKKGIGRVIKGSEFFKKVMKD